MPELNNIFMNSRDNDVRSCKKSLFNFLKENGKNLCDLTINDWNAIIPNEDTQKILINQIKLYQNSTDRNGYENGMNGTNTNTNTDDDETDVDDDDDFLKKDYNNENDDIKIRDDIKSSNHNNNNNDYDEPKARSLTPIEISLKQVQMAFEEELYKMDKNYKYINIINILNDKYELKDEFETEYNELSRFLLLPYKFFQNTNSLLHQHYCTTDVYKSAYHPHINIAPLNKNSLSHKAFPVLR